MGWQDNTFEMVIVKGTNGGVFLYDSSGNLIASMAVLADVDPETHSNQPGITSYEPGQLLANLFLGSLGLNSLNPSTTILSSAGGGVRLIDSLAASAKPATSLFSPATSASDFAAAVTAYGRSQDGSALEQVLIDNNGSGGHNSTTAALLEVQGTEAADSLWVPASRIPVGTMPTGAETWHAVTFQNSWVNAAGRTNAQYRLVASPPRSTEITGCVTVPVGFAIGQVIFNLPANYRPASPGSVIGIDITTNAIVHLGYGTGGNITYQGGAGAAGDEIDFWALINRDA